MRGARTGSRAVLAAGGCLVLALTGCSSKHEDAPRPAQPLTADSAYERAVVQDGASALWSFRGVTGLAARDEIADLTAAKAAATVVGGTVAQTTGPDGTAAAQFLRGGRLVTPVTSGLSSSDAFSLELDLRADACVSAWGRVLGTTSLPKSGREGFELLHFPKQFAVSPCRFGAEFWHLGKYLGGCHPKQVPVDGVWTHWSVVYATGRVTCYQDGQLVQSTALTAPRVFRQVGPLGLGGSGSGFQGPLDGASLGEVAFYRRALTPAEVRHHAGLSKAPAGTPSPRPSGT